MQKGIERRFWKYVDARSKNECWGWKASVHRQGYGWLRCNGRMHLAHRVSYAIYHGKDIEQLDGIVICHTCDNPGCCNPNHLFAGTQQDNIRDMDAKGRRPLGEKAKHAKLTNAQAEKVRTMYHTGKYLQSDLSAKFGIDKSQISRIINYKAYRNG